MASPSLVWNQGWWEDGTRQLKSRIACDIVSFHLFKVCHVVFLLDLLTTPGGGCRLALEPHPGRYFTLVFLSALSVMCSGLRLLLHDILARALLETVSTVQDITMTFYLTTYSITLVGGILFLEGISFQNITLLGTALLLYSVVNYHLFRLWLRFMAFTKWDLFAKWDKDISELQKMLRTPHPELPVEQTFYLYAVCIACISMMLIGTTHILLGSEEWADIASNFQTDVSYELFRKLMIFVFAWGFVNLTVHPFLPVPASRISASNVSPTSSYLTSISICFPRLRQLCSIFDLVASLSMFAFAAANSHSLFRMEPILLFQGHTSWIQAVFWARQLLAIAASFFTGVMFLVIRRERSLVHSMTTIEQLRSTIVDSINGPEGLEFLVKRKPQWTDEEIVSLLKLRGLTEKGRDKVASFLYNTPELVEFREKEMNDFHKKWGRDPEWFTTDDEDSDEGNAGGSDEGNLPTYGPEGSDLELGLG